MLRFRKTFLFLLFTALTAAPRPASAALIPRFDLNSLCFWSSSIVEAALVKHHHPGRPVWSDTYTATVLNSLEGKYKAGDQIKGLDLELYSPNEVRRHCLLFIAPAGYPDRSQHKKSDPPAVVDMLLIDNKGVVHRYYQQSDPGLLVADYSPRSSHFALAEERTIIMSKWTAAKKLKAPPPGLPYQILR